MNIPEAETCASASRQSENNRITQARRNPFGKIYCIYIFSALVITDPIWYADPFVYADLSLSLFLSLSLSLSLSIIIIYIYISISKLMGR